MATTITLNLKKSYHDSSDSDLDAEKAQLQSDEEKDEQEKDLENLVFGAESCLVSNIDRIHRQKKKKTTKKFKSILTLATDGEQEEAKKDDQAAEDKPLGKVGRPKQIADALQERRPVWQDAADEEM